MWMSRRRRDPALALRAVGGLLGGTLLGLWAVGLIRDLFSEPRAWSLAAVSVFLIAIGALLGWAHSRKRRSSRGGFRPALARAVYTVLIFAGILVVWLVGPPGYQCGAALAAAFLFAIGVTVVRRWRARREVSKDAPR